jgi:hypothetical protein
MHGIGLLLAVGAGRGGIGISWVHDVTGSLYLFGDIQQPPFRCEALASLGADYLAFLAAQFGPHQCRLKAAPIADGG